MAEIAGRLGAGRLDDFSKVKDAAAEVGVTAETLKRWLRQEKVRGVNWGRDNRNWIWVAKADIPKLKTYKTEIRLS